MSAASQSPPAAAATMAPNPAVVANIGVMLSFLVAFSMARPLLQPPAAASAESIVVVSYVALLAGSATWCLYGLLMGSSTIFWQNLGMGALSIVYFALIARRFWPLATPRVRQAQVRTVTRCFLMFLFGFVPLCFVKRKEWVGVFATVLQIIMVASPSTLLYNYYKHGVGGGRSGASAATSQNLPDPLISAANAASNITWLWFGWLVGDRFIQTSSLLSSLCSLPLLAIIFKERYFSRSVVPAAGVTGGPSLREAASGMYAPDRDSPKVQVEEKDVALL